MTISSTITMEHRSEQELCIACVNAREYSSVKCWCDSGFGRGKANQWMAAEAQLITNNDRNNDDASWTLGCAMKVNATSSSAFAMLPKPCCMPWHLDKLVSFANRSTAIQ